MRLVAGHVGHWSAPDVGDPLPVALLDPEGEVLVGVGREVRHGGLHLLLYLGLEGTSFN